MEGKIVEFRRSRRTKYNTQMIVEVPSYTSKEKSSQLVNKQLVWTSPGKLKKQIKGTVKTTHGNKGLLRVHFEKGMPGQAINTKVTFS